MGENDNSKPEYAGGSDDLLEQRYLGNYIPVQDEATGNGVCRWDMVLKVEM